MDYYFDWLVFCNGSPLPIAGFAWRDQAEEWAEENYPGVWEVRQRPNMGIKPTPDLAPVDRKSYNGR